MEKSGEILIEARGLYRFYGNRCAVRDVSFRLARGEVLGFLGPNGAGKSTTMQVLSGNLAPSAGSVTVDGHDLLDEPRLAKQRLGYLPEQPPLYRELTVREFLSYCARLHRIPGAQRAAALDSAVQRCGLEEVVERLIGNISKGFQQRVGIAQAILHNPAVVILDEPTVGLDPIQIREIRGLIRELGRDHGVILSTHILPEIHSVCTRVQIIHHGSLVFADTIDGLDQRLASSSLVVQLRQAPPSEELLAIPGASRVEALEDGRIEVHYEGKDPAEEIARRAVAGNWGLLELTPKRRTLEQVFVELTCSEPTTTQEAPAA